MGEARHGRGGGGRKREQDSKRKGWDEHPRLRETSMRYGEGGLRGSGQSLGCPPAPRSPPQARAARRAGDTAAKGIEGGE